MALVCSFLQKYELKSKLEDVRVMLEETKLQAQANRGSCAFKMYKPQAFHRFYYQ